MVSFLSYPRHAGRASPRRGQARTKAELSVVIIYGCHTLIQTTSRFRDDIRIETVTDIIAKFVKSQEKRLQDHINIEAFRLLNVNNITRRLKRKKPFELVGR
jgi:hypothetical protein